MQVINCANENVSEWMNEWMRTGLLRRACLCITIRAPCEVTQHALPCVMWRPGSVHMADDSRSAWGAQAGRSSSPLSRPLSRSPPSSSLSNNGLSPCSLSPWSPPDPISCFICPLSNYLYLTLRPAGQHGWLVSCQQSKWGTRGISWSFYRSWPGSWQRASLATPERCRHSCMNNFAPLM